MDTLAELIDAVVNQRAPTRQSLGPTLPQRMPFESPVAQSIRTGARPSLADLAAADMHSSPALEGSPQDQQSAAYAPQPRASFDNGRYPGADLAEMTGLPALRRGIQHTTDSIVDRADPQRSADEAGAAIPDVFQGGLGVLGLLGGGDAAMAPELPRMRAPFAEADVTPPLTAPPRDLGRTAPSLPRRTIDTPAGQVVVNPSQADMMRLTRRPLGEEAYKSGTLRYIQDNAGNVYAARAYDLTHDDIARAVQSNGGAISGYEPHMLPGDSHGPDVRTGTIIRRGDTLDGLPQLPSQGGVLPIRASEPFRNSLRGGTNDLMDAAGMRSSASPPDAGGAWLRHLQDQGFDTTRPVYHGTDAPVEGDLRPGKAGMMGPAIYVSHEPSLASSYATSNGEASNVMPMYARGLLADMDTVRAARDEVVQHRIDAGQSVRGTESAAIWRETHDLLKSRGFRGISNEDSRQVAMFDASDLAPRFGRAPAQSDGGQAAGGQFIDQVTGRLGAGAAETRQLTSPAGNIDYIARSNEWKVKSSNVAQEARGQGHGVALYEELIRRARAAGVRTLSSDSNVSPDAVRVWEALRRRGYSIEEGRSNLGSRRVFSLDLGSGPNAPTQGQAAGGPSGWERTDEGGWRLNAPASNKGDHIALEVGPLSDGTREIHWDFGETRLHGGTDAVMPEIRLRRQFEQEAIAHYDQVGRPQGVGVWDLFGKTPRGQELNAEISSLQKNRMDQSFREGQQWTRQVSIPAFRAVEKGLREFLDTAPPGESYVFSPANTGLAKIYDQFARTFRHPRFTISGADGNYVIRPKFADSLFNRNRQGPPLAASRRTPQAPDGGQAAGGRNATPFYDYFNNRTNMSLGVPEIPARRAEVFSDPRLSPNQNKVVEMLRNGFTTPEIADELESTPGSVATAASQARRRAPDIHVPGSNAQRGPENIVSATVERLMAKGITSRQAILARTNAILAESGRRPTTEAVIGVRMSRVRMASGAERLRPSVTPDEVAQMWALHDQGLSHEAIGVRVGRTQPTVSNWLRKPRPEISRTQTPPTQGGAPDRPNGARALVPIGIGLGAAVQQAPRRRTNRPPAQIHSRRQTQPPSGGFFMPEAN